MLQIRTKRCAHSWVVKLESTSWRRGGCKVQPQMPQRRFSATSQSPISLALRTQLNSGRYTNMCTPTYMCWPVVLFVHLLPLCPVSESFRRLVKWSARRETDSVRAQWKKLFSWTNIPFNVKYQTQSPTTTPPFWPVHKHQPSLLTLQSTCPQAPSLSQNGLCPICTVKALPTTLKSLSFL